MGTGECHVLSLLLHYVGSPFSSPFACHHLAALLCRCLCVLCGVVATLCFVVCVAQHVGATIFQQAGVSSAHGHLGLDLLYCILYAVVFGLAIRECDSRGMSVCATSLSTTTRKAIIFINGSYQHHQVKHHHHLVIVITIIIIANNETDASELLCVCV
jgi:hypothetical protein